VTAERRALGIERQLEDCLHLAILDSDCGYNYVGKQGQVSEMATLESARDQVTRVCRQATPSGVETQLVVRDDTTPVQGCVRRGPLGNAPFQPIERQEVGPSPTIQAAQTQSRESLHFKGNISSFSGAERGDVS
jgi:hypothetical protein